MIEVTCRKSYCRNCDCPAKLSVIKGYGNKVVFWRIWCEGCPAYAESKDDHNAACNRWDRIQSNLAGGEVVCVDCGDLTGVRPGFGFGTACSLCCNCSPNPLSAIEQFGVTYADFLKRHQPPDILGGLQDISDYCEQQRLKCQHITSTPAVRAGWHTGLLAVKAMVKTLKEAIAAEKARRSSERGDWP